MAKGQKRSNREQRKPKREKAPAKVETPFATQVRQAANANAGREKSKT
jgi:hypothetical protein